MQKTKEEQTKPPLPPPPSQILTAQQQAIEETDLPWELLPTFGAGGLLGWFLRGKAGAIKGAISKLLKRKRKLSTEPPKETLKHVEPPKEPPKAPPKEPPKEPPKAGKTKEERISVEPSPELTTFREHLSKLRTIIKNKDEKALREFKDQIEDFLTKNPNHPYVEQYKQILSFIESALPKEKQLPIPKNIWEKFERTFKDFQDTVAKGQKKATKKSSKPKETPKTEVEEKPKKKKEQPQEQKIEQQPKEQLEREVEEKPQEQPKKKSIKKKIPDISKDELKKIDNEVSKLKQKDVLDLTSDELNYLRNAQRNLITILENHKEHKLKNEIKKTLRKINTILTDYDVITKYE